MGEADQFSGFSKCHLRELLSKCASLASHFSIIFHFPNVCDFFAMQIDCNEIMKMLFHSISQVETGWAGCFVCDLLEHSMADHFVLRYFAAHIMVSLSRTRTLVPQKPLPNRMHSITTTTSLN